MKLITFDFWNTLFLDRDEGTRHTKRIRFAYEVIRKHHPIVCMDDVEGAFEEAHELFNRQWEQRQAVTMRSHFEKMLSHLDLTLPELGTAEVVDYFESILLDHPPLVIENAVVAVRHAASRTKVGLISDTGYSPGRTLVRVLENHSIRHSFHAFSFSNETGFLKPSPQAFLKVLRELNVKPEEAVHVGDLEDTDIAGARSVGMKAIKYIGSNPVAVRESQADIVIESLTELPAALASFE